MTSLIILPSNENRVVILKFFGLNTPQSKSIVCEVGLQNGTLAIFIANSIFGKAFLFLHVRILSSKNHWNITLRQIHINLVGY